MQNGEGTHGEPDALDSGFWARWKEFTTEQTEREGFTAEGLARRSRNQRKITVKNTRSRNT